jgi:hypothetical protein
MPEPVTWGPATRTDDATLASYCSSSLVGASSMTRPAADREQRIASRGRLRAHAEFVAFFSSARVVCGKETTGKT